MGVAGNLNDNADITAPVRSFWPNDYGLYCMAGNVSEWGMDVYRPYQATPVPNFFLAGSYTQQDYIDSMEGATISGKQAAKVILEAAETLKKSPQVSTIR